MDDRATTVSTTVTISIAVKPSSSSPETIASRLRAIFARRNQSASFFPDAAILEAEKRTFMERWQKPQQRRAALRDFCVKELLAAGAFGRVFIARHNTSGEYYAIKVLSKRRHVERRQVQHIFNEKKILLAADWPFIVQLKFLFKDNANLYLVQEFIAGGDMFTHLRTLKRFKEPHSRFYAAQVILALEYLHFMNIIHRDLKPENILIRSNGYLKITDMGGAKHVPDGRTQTFCGTPEYIAPELYNHVIYNKAIDWWSFGILLYEMTHGRPPFENDPTDEMALSQKIVSGRYRQSRYFSRDLKDLISNLIQVDITRRFGNLRNGVADIKAHKWLSGIDWEAIYHQRIMPASFKDKVPGAKLEALYPKLDRTEPYDLRHFPAIQDNQDIPTSKIPLFEEEFADF